MFSLLPLIITPRRKFFYTAMVLQFRFIEVTSSFISFVASNLTELNKIDLT